MQHLENDFFLAGCDLTRKLLYSYQAAQ